MQSTGRHHLGLRSRLPCRDNQQILPLNCWPCFHFHKSPPEHNSPPSFLSVTLPLICAHISCLHPALLPPPQALFLGLKLSLSQEFCPFIRLAVLLLSPFLADTLSLCENKLLSGKMAQEVSHCPGLGFYPQNHAGPFTHSMAQVFSSHTQNGNVVLPPCALHSLFLAHLSQALLNFHPHLSGWSATVSKADRPFSLHRIIRAE